MNGWNDEERSEFLATGLGNDAQKVLSGLSSDDCFLYPKVVERLELLFGAEKQLHLHQARFQSRRQQPKESLQSLALDIRSMVDLVYQELLPDLRERFAVQRFVVAVCCQKDHFPVLVNKPRTLCDALFMACELQALHTIDYVGDEGVRIDSDPPFQTRVIGDVSNPTNVTQTNNSQIEELCKKLESLQQQVARQHETQESIVQMGLTYPILIGIPHQDLLSTSRCTRGRRSPQAEPTQRSGRSTVRPKASKSTPFKRIVCS